MTFKERLEIEHPDYVGEGYYAECNGCPFVYGMKRKSSQERIVVIHVRNAGTDKSQWNEENKW